MSVSIVPKKKQKTYSLPEATSIELDHLFDENNEYLKKLGITNKTQLLVALLENGKPLMQKYLNHVKEQT